ncbi:MAG TPA: sigma-70 family RNA polymerase sigma factor [Ktedonobacteraceae bacterium]|nr:sigma-70 family RNA polymerase sigma factor [Ktedonobacteraceae bacterium]
MQPDQIQEGQAPPSEVALYDQHGPAIFGYLRLHTTSLEDAEDLLLEVFLAACEQDNLASFPPKARLAWLKRVAQHKLANAYRRSYRRPQVSLDMLTEAFVEKDQPELVVLKQEAFSVLRGGITLVS